MDVDKHEGELLLSEFSQEIVVNRCVRDIYLVRVFQEILSCLLLGCQVVKVASMSVQLKDFPNECSFLGFRNAHSCHLLQELLIQWQFESTLVKFTLKSG